MNELRLLQFREAIGKAKELLANKGIGYNKSSTEEEMQLIDDFNDAIIGADLELHDAMEKIEGLMRRGYGRDN
ncbi:hypothetical protein D8911_11555 [Levilactobacillus brevis]|nr:hypothetical protein D8911_11555 [Levilactobacillus brevis]